jgi:5,10-methylenetetrahydromethanopterin reductase
MTTRAHEPAPLPVMTVSDFPAKGNTLTVREIASLAATAEENGAQRFGVTDFPYYYDCVPTMVACLAATRELEIESLVTTPYARHPEATACAFATMSDFSNGRVILGVGGGVEEPSNVWMEPWGRARPRPLTAMRELIGLCRTMWAGTSTCTEGRVLKGSGLTLKFALRHPVPILIAARGEKMLELAGELADIVHIAAPFLGTAYISAMIDRIAAGAARAGRSLADFEIDLTVSTCLMEDAELARSLARITTGAAILWMSGQEKYAQLRNEWHVPDELRVPKTLVDELATTWDMWSGEDLPDSCAAMMDDDVLDQFSVAGDPGDCLERLSALVDAFPMVTGLRFKLPPLHGPESFERYTEMVRGIGELLSRWTAREDGRGPTP